YDVEIWSCPLNLNEMIRAITALPRERPVAILGFSLGANGAAWLAYWLKVYKRQIALIVGFDPTKNGASLSDFPIGNNVKRCICFHQTNPDLFGNGAYVRAKDGPVIEVHNFADPHLAGQFYRPLQDIAVAAIKEIS